MTTKEPRYQVLLKPEDRELVERLAVAMGQSRSQIIAELIESARPVLTAMVEAAEVFAAASQAEKERMRTHMAQLDQEMTPGMEQLHLDLASGVHDLGRFKHDGQN